MGSDTSLAPACPAANLPSPEFIDPTGAGSSYPSPVSPGSGTIGASLVVAAPCAWSP
jgi:hypothetical protein